MDSDRPTSDDSHSDDSHSEVVALYRELHDVLDRIAQVDTTPASDVEVVEVADAHERAVRRMSGLGHHRLMDVSDRGAFTKFGYRNLTDFLGDRLKISEPRVRQRHTAALAPRFSMQGEKMPPTCPNTAQALIDGAISVDHVDIILKTLHRIPAALPVAVSAAAEAEMADMATKYSTDALIEIGKRILGHVDPDGTLTDDRDRARQRRLGVGKQDMQDMSKLAGLLDPKTRAMLDVVLASWAAPGMNNPADDTPLIGSTDDVIDAEQLRQAVERDHRSQPQRNHDALAALLRHALDGGILGNSHRGLPPHLIIKITESELRERAGVATTTSGARLPISTLIELAAHSQMHLAVFADHTGEPLYLGTAKRLANQAQRFMLFAHGGGCSCPGCTRAFDTVEIHHAERDYADGGTTDINTLTPACGPHNRMVGTKPGQYTTDIIKDGPNTGRAQWTLNTDGTTPPNPPRINELPFIGELFERRLREHTPDRNHPGTPLQTIIDEINQTRPQTDQPARTPTHRTAEQTLAGALLDQLLQRDPISNAVAHGWTITDFGPEGYDLSDLELAG